MLTVLRFFHCHIVSLSVLHGKQFSHVAKLHSHDTSDTHETETVTIK